MKEVSSAKIFFFVLFNLFCLVAFGQRVSRAEYIKRYAQIAEREMKATGIPASITLAQGCLESDDGNSQLAKEGNNHFGIKCHKDWNGEKMFVDDDQKGECFRKYQQAEDSYIDHSNFLKSATRYASLFNLGISDYKGWAKGLKEAGYATNPKYPDLLIKIIEDNKLYEYDNLSSVVNSTEHKKSRNRFGKANPDGPELTLNGYTVKLNNRIKYIIAKEGDTPELLARNFEMLAWELFRYNDITRDSILRKGQMIYLQPKRCRTEKGHDIHSVKEGETLYLVSQKYGVKMRSLRRKNHLISTQEIRPGDVIYLRKRK